MDLRAIKFGLRSGSSVPSTSGSDACLQEHRIAVKLQEPALSLRERAGVDLPVDTHAHFGQRLSMCDGRNEHDAFVAEGDESTIEEVVYGGRQQEPVLRVEPVMVVAVSPRLAVARAQVLGAVDVGDSAR